MYVTLYDFLKYVSCLLNRIVSWVFPQFLVWIRAIFPNFWGIPGSCKAPRVKFINYLYPYVHKKWVCFFLLIINFVLHRAGNAEPSKKLKMEMTSLQKLKWKFPPLLSCQTDIPMVSGTNHLSQNHWIFTIEAKNYTKSVIFFSSWDLE